VAKKEPVPSRVKKGPPAGQTGPGEPWWICKIFGSWGRENEGGGRKRRGAGNGVLGGEGRGTVDKQCGTGGNLRKGKKT